MFIFLGLSVGVVTHETPTAVRVVELAKDITYTTGQHALLAMWPVRWLGGGQEGEGGAAACAMEC